MILREVNRVGEGQKNVPKLRFKGYEDAWEQRKLGEIAESTYGGGTPKTMVEEFWNGGIPWIQSSDIQEDQVFNVQVRKTITEKGLANSAAKLIPKNSVAIVTRVGVGKLGLIPFDFTTSQDFLSLSNLNIDSNFAVYLLFKRLQFESKMAQGTSIKGITKEELLSKEVKIAHIDMEQKSIGYFFQNLDDIITLHQRKYDALKSMKKTLLLKMFPKDGKDVPEIRFKEFTDAWEQRSFKEITFLSGKKNKDNLPLESYSITNEEGFVPQNEHFENGGTMKDADKSMYIIVSANSFASNPARINVGSIGYKADGEDVIVSSLYEVFKTIEDIDDNFLWHWFKSPHLQRLIMKFQEGGVRLYFYYNKLCLGYISVPEYREQNKISQTLGTLDNLITLHQRKLDELKNMKKTLLQQMFV